MMRILPLLLGLGFTASQSTDQTLQDRATGTMVADATVDKIQTACIFDNDRVFLRRIALVESKDGLDPQTFRNGYYGGIWQVSEARFKQTQDSSAHASFPSIYTKIQTQFGINWQNVQWTDLTKPLYSGLAARLCLFLITNDIPWGVADQGTLWKTKYTTNPNAGTEADFITTVEAFEEVCNVPKADITFLLDTSGSIGSSNYNTMKDFVAKVVESFNIGQDDVRIGLVTFSSDSKLEFALDKYSSKSDVTSAVRAVSYRSGGTYTSKGLDQLRSMMNSKKRTASAGVPRIAIVMTDGKSNSLSQTRTAAELVHADGIKAFAVGVTSGIRQEELEAIGSEPKCLHVFTLASFSDVTHFKNEIARRSCRVPAVVYVGESVSGTLNTGQSQYLNLNVNQSGLTFKLGVSSGAVAMYTSYTIPNPSDALHDQKIQVDSSMLNGLDVFIPYPGVDRVRRQTQTEKTVYVAITGTGSGQPNTFKLDTLLGNQSGASGVSAMMSLIVLSSVLLLLI